MRTVLTIATVLGVVGPIAAFGLFYLGDRVLHIDRPQLQTMMYLLLSVAGHLILFGSLQTITANQIGVSAVLMASANAAGGVMGKMIAAPSIVGATTATEIYGQEGASCASCSCLAWLLAAGAGIVVYLMAYVAPFTSLVAR